MSSEPKPPGNPLGNRPSVEANLHPPGVMRDRPLGRYAYAFHASRWPPAARLCQEAFRLTLTFKRLDHGFVPLN